ncbi:hypothetical protein ACERC8_01305 [Streptococcus sp. E29BA]|uniref:hypothetical protein n=1 Tax=Streptococcus sp. E29BA TaxID=3278716 RepID=UPI00359D8828
MTVEVKVNGVSSRTVRGCLLTTLGDWSGSAPRFVEETVYGMNGVNRTIEAYGETERKLGFHCESFEAVGQIIRFFQGMDRRLELWPVPDSFYYFDFKESEYQFHHKQSWDVTITLAIKPFRYLLGVEPISLTDSGAIRNLGDVFSEPRVTIYGSGATSLTIGKQVMRLTLDTKATIECRHGFQNIYDKNDVIKNSIRTSGTFFEIPASSDPIGVVLGDGISRVEIEPRWRFQV